MAQTSKQIGQRGKYAESEVVKIFDEWNRSVLAFAYERLPDARAARGAIKAQLCDFIVHLEIGRPTTFPRFVMVEAKESSHDYRIAKDKVDQLPRMAKWIRAGSKGVLIVYHTALNEWRAVPIQDLTIGQASWDLRTYPLFPDARSALLSYECFRGLP